MNRLALLSLCVWPLCGLAVSRTGGPAPTLDGVAFFEQKLRPVLIERRLKCHSGGQADKIRGGDGGPVIVPGDPESRTFRHVGRDFRLTDVHGRVVEEILA